MNSTELFVAASDAIGRYRETHDTPCILSFENGKVCCKQALGPNRWDNNPLYISKFEIDYGMPQNRWTAIGTALHNLYCKELSCQAHQKH